MDVSRSGDADGDRLEARTEGSTSNCFEFLIFITVPILWLLSSIGGSRVWFKELETRYEVYEITACTVRNINVHTLLRRWTSSAIGTGALRSSSISKPTNPYFVAATTLPSAKSPLISPNHIPGLKKTRRASKEC